MAGAHGHSQRPEYANQEARSIDGCARGGRRAPPNSNGFRRSIAAHLREERGDAARLTQMAARRHGGDYLHSLNPKGAAAPPSVKTSRKTGKCRLPQQQVDVQSVPGIVHEPEGSSHDCDLDMFFVRCERCRDEAIRKKPARSGLGWRRCKLEWRRGRRTCEEAAWRRIGWGCSDCGPAYMMSMHKGWRRPLSLSGCTATERTNTLVHIKGAAPVHVFADLAVSAFPPAPPHLPPSTL